MNLTELQDKVVEITGRPDLSALTLSAIQSATLKAHRFDYFPKDLFQGVIDTGSSSSEKELSTTLALPRFRTMNFIRVYDIVTGKPTLEFNIIDALNLNDMYGVQRPNVAFLAGDNFRLKAATAFQYLYVSYYTDPVITTLGFASWIANNYPFAIIYEAAAQVFRSIGQMEKFRSQRDLVSDELTIIRTTSIQQVGY
jgi:hypothetical protein